MKSCAVDYFPTKISWNDTNAFPFDTFWWEGLDGTRAFRILTQLTTSMLKMYPTDWAIKQRVLQTPACLLSVTVTAVYRSLKKLNLPAELRIFPVSVRRNFVQSAILCRTWKIGSQSRHL